MKKIMWIENNIFHEDMQNIAKASYIPWKKLQDKTILITGATGLIGFNLVSALTYVALYKDIALKIIALVRDEEQAKKRFHEILTAGAPLRFLVGDLNHIPLIFHYHNQHKVHI